MTHIKKDIIIKNPQGLHARPAAILVQIASKYNSNVTIQKGDEKVNGKSIMGILTLGAHKNSKVKVEIDGDDAEKVMADIVELLTREHSL